MFSIIWLFSLAVSFLKIEFIIGVKILSVANKMILPKLIEAPVVLRKCRASTIFYNNLNDKPQENKNGKIDSALL